MRKRKRILIAVTIALFLIVLAIPAAAQSNGVVQASVDRQALSTDETLTLTVAVDLTAGDSGEPILPALNGFELLSSSRSQQISIMNGDMRMEHLYNYVLHPLQTGELEIGSIAVQMGSQLHQTAPIRISVSAGTGIPVQPPQGNAFPSIPGFPSMPSFPNFPNFPNMPALPSNPGTGASPGVAEGGQLDATELPPGLNGQEFYVDARVDNAAPYQGEQVIYTFRFYQAGELYDQPEYGAPTFTGLWHEQLEGQTEYSAQAAGRNYRVTELKTVLFPTVVGPLTIDASELVIPGGFFSRGQTLHTEAVSMDVKALPDPAPVGFRGAVGQFVIDATVDNNATTVNETISWNVAISGSGNLENLPDPNWSEGAEWRAFESDATVEAGFRDGAWRGSRAYERILVPTQAGNMNLPAIEYIYFNPTTGSYESAETMPLPVTVASAAGAAAPIQTLADPGKAPQVAGAPGAEALRPQKPAASLAAGQPLVARPAFWLLWLIPVAMIASHVGWRSWRKQRLASADARQRKGAIGQANRALRQAEQQPELAGPGAGPILQDYLATKLGRSLSGLTHSAVVDRVRAAGVSDELAFQTQTILNRSDAQRFAPDADAGGQELLAETRQLISELDKTLS